MTGLLSPVADDDVNAFGAVAEVYDHLMRVIPYRMWVGYYQLLLSAQQIKPQTVLDVACGTGNMCELLYREGYAMTGIDLSAPMIAIAREKAAKKKLPIRYEVQDARNFELEQPFDAALSFFDSLNNILTPEGLYESFCCIHRHLVPGGSFIFDLNTAFAFRAKLFDQQNLRSTTKLKYKWKGNWDESTQTITVDMQFWKEDRHFSEIHRQRAYPNDLVVGLLAEAGFKNIRLYHSYSIDPPRPKSDRIHYTATA